MIHNLTARGGRQVYITWEIDWVPETDPGAHRHQPGDDPAGSTSPAPRRSTRSSTPSAASTRNGDGKYVFPDEVPTDPSLPGYEERANISPARSWTVPNGGVTLVFGAGHLHPGGLHVDLQVARDGPDAGTVDGDDPSEVQTAVPLRRPLLRARRRRELGRQHGGDAAGLADQPEGRATRSRSTPPTTSSKASWYESMGILPLAVTTRDDPAARDPFDDAAAVQADVRRGRHPHPRPAAREHRPQGAQEPRSSRTRASSEQGPRVPAVGDRRSTASATRPGGYSARPGLPAAARCARRWSSPGTSVTFTNLDALPTMPQTEQAWHTITSCKAPCNRGSGIGYPLAAGRSSSTRASSATAPAPAREVTTGSNVYTTPPLTKPGKTYTYFCRIHPFMRGSIRVKAKSK